MSIAPSKYLTEAELKGLLRVLERFQDKHERDCLLIRILLETGARASEALAIEPSDLDPDNRTVFIRGLKNSNDRQVAISDKTFSHLLKYSAGKQGRIFPITYNRLGDIWREFRPVKKKLHSLRHTRAMRLFDKSQNIRTVQKILGHKNLNTTTIYETGGVSHDEIRSSI
jgi:integrase/recombinase XerC